MLIDKYEQRSEVEAPRVCFALGLSLTKSASA